MPDERTELIEAGKELYSRGLLAGTWGNISERLEENEDLFLITPSGMDYSEIGREDLVTMRLDGTKVEGEKAPSTEKPMHSMIYETKEEIGAIVHTHSRSASAISCLRTDVPPILEDMVQIIGGSIDTANYEKPGTEELADSVLEALGDKKAALLANHGAVSIGENMKEALKVAEITEKSAEIYILARQVGEPKELDEKEVKDLREMYEDYK